MGKVFVAIAVFAVLCAVSTEAVSIDTHKRLRMRRTAACTAAGGSCIAESACGSGTIQHGLCPGVTYCCVPHAGAAAAPVAPAPAAPVSAFSAQGVDVSVAASADSLKCFLDPTHPKHKVTSTAGSGAIGPALTAAQAKLIEVSKFDHFGIRTPLYDGKTSPAATIKAAITAGFQPANINVYFISFKAAEGAAATLARMIAETSELLTTSFGTLWLDVETGPNYWTTNTATNCAYLTQLVRDIQADKTHFPWALGIYSGLSTWGEKVGACDMTVFRDLPFWYAAYTGRMDFSYSTAHPMGAHGWANPNVCQWRGTTGFCGAEVDFNIFR